ncbi:PIN domain-containing protein [Streptomyces sp. WAC 04229]|uniref:PIN domain-containing protein n=1 Tax=Streptomyces sp. WAC 04229 TaxID=2203206 RepID=UPI003D754A88
MIILDTCIVESFKLDSVGSDLLKTIRRSGVERVAVPWAVMMELISHRAVPYRQKHEELINAMRRFTAAAPPSAPVPTPPLRDSEFAAMWRARFEEIAEVLPTSKESLMEAVVREANVLPPCKAVVVSQGGDTVKTGGRDAEIWLTAVNYARQYPEETVYFVSRNTRDFGDGSAYPEPMLSDLAGIGDRFVHLTSLADVVERFAAETDIAETEVEAFLREPETLRHVSATAYRKFRVEQGVSGRSFECTPLEKVDGGPPEEPLDSCGARGWLIAPKVKLAEVRDVKAYRIGEHVWCMASVRWLLAGLGLANGVAAWHIGVAWDTRVLLSTTEGTSRPTLLRTSPPKAVAADAFAEFTDLPRFSMVGQTPWHHEAAALAQVDLVTRELARLQGPAWHTWLEDRLLRRSDHLGDPGGEEGEG